MSPCKTQRETLIGSLKPEFFEVIVAWGQINIWLMLKAMDAATGGWRIVEHTTIGSVVGVSLILQPLSVQYVWAPSFPFLNRVFEDKTCLRRGMKQQLEPQCVSCFFFSPKSDALWKGLAFREVRVELIWLIETFHYDIRPKTSINLQYFFCTHCHPKPIFSQRGGIVVTFHLLWLLVTPWPP